MLDDEIYSATKVEFEQKLFKDLEELDDPLELFLDYISWLNQYHDNDAELISLLKRCIDYISNIDTYSNDPRLIKIWLLYIKLYSNNNLNIQLKQFIIMINHPNKIGYKLSLFYETIANLLFNLKYFKNCLLILKFGINLNARPLIKLKNLFNHYKNIIPQKYHHHDSMNLPLNLIDCISLVNEPVYKIIGEKNEKIDCNFNLLYQDNESMEFNFDQILALSRNFYYKKIFFSQNLSSLSKSKHKIYIDTTEELSPIKLQKINKENQYTNITNTSLLPLKDDNESNDSKKKQNESVGLTQHHSPTVTMFSKDAIDDVYSMFNQQNQPFQHDDTITTTTNTTTTNKYAVFEGDGFTQDFTRQNIDDLTDINSYQNNKDKKLKENITMEFKSTLQDFMTPIKEFTENNEFNNNNNNNNIIKSTQSSPFLTQPPVPVPVPIPIPNSMIIEHPFDSNLRNKLLLTIDPPLDQYKNFYRYNQSLKMSTLLKKIHKLSKTENKNPIIDFKKTNDLYCIRSELGQGGYAIVYLAESSKGNLKALKIERPASVWEYYILKQIEARLYDNQKILKSIIQVDSLHYFLDESYLVLNYANQGTVLDLINSMDNNSVDELLCMFLTIELMKIIESLHDIGIIHGDLKPDNCMIRFEPILINSNQNNDKSINLGRYNKYSKDGWNFKGIYLIDFGRSFDMNLFPNGTTFKSDWKTDQQDCSQMRLGKEWTFEADYYGLAGIIHSLLFGQFIDTIRLPNNKYKLRKPFKRYWHTKLWDDIFNLLLNSGDNNFGPLPLTSNLKKLRQSLENILEQDINSDKLRRIILDLETDLMSKDKTNETHINK
ncbi:similar to Saccharomyces cerevisiae YJL013C MAD3 Subunit of the spindle-assembly checkpoint complex, which delays anaphase onset in cells with defects in mitotic spindle assembly [Maudiozyma saulgeensis]|uniref:Similar to Saccharomyces cerevisiae YJL013C MAD3 Subunit of the spindle-assembly checkpoint complex, which delays anaphase onset in cells with defects in mitotic spindle assembly n=1 Tax=Maudiozyma saulgeensis TaxID=1789683 RepID=A0A1X7R7M6_9SACH|nr:similar to Saccharomyces cerevisiae YJL013C MAD3 Subunit of the spindle-assembly checkpoint complex, which delays anaphase onset in cells with defects in mitotic spindle assembly [Kazachstania saulgeensis]